MVAGLNPLEGTAGTKGFLASLLEPYKPGQGTATRRIAYAIGVGFLFWGCFDLWVWLQGFTVLQKPLMQGALRNLPLGGPAVSPSLLLAVALFLGGWAWVTRYLKTPWLANLLIETEGEMKKVSWPGQEEAWGATKVVTVTVVIFTLTLLFFDFGIAKVMKLLFNLEI